MIQISSVNWLIQFTKPVNDSAVKFNSRDPSSLRMGSSMNNNLICSLFLLYSLHYVEKLWGCINDEVNYPFNWKLLSWPKPMILANRSAHCSILLFYTHMWAKADWFRPAIIPRSLFDAGPEHISYVWQTSGLA